MKSKRWILCAVVFLLLTACGQEKEPAVLSDLIPEMKEADCRLGFYVAVDHHGELYVQGDDGQTKEGLELLDRYDLTKLVELGQPAEQRGWSGGDQVYLRWEEGGCRISRSYDREEQFSLLLTYDSGEQRCFVGEIARIEELEALRDAVVSRTADSVTLYTADAPEGYHPSVAYACMGLDDLEDRKSPMGESEAIEPSGDAAFDVRLVVENTDFILGNFYDTESLSQEEREKYLNTAITLTDTEYEIDTEKGIFVRRTAEDVQFYRFKAGRLPMMGIGQLVRFR